MDIHKNFIGGNITVEKIEGNDIFLKNEIRDTTQDWFYWAFCAEGALGKTLTFHFEEKRLGYYGPAVSHDLKSWQWLNSLEKDKFVFDFENNKFTYKFDKDEKKVYFAHDMLYSPDRFYDFAESENLEVKELCKSGKGRSIPCVFFGEGKKTIILASRHHACENTGNYVLEGVLSELLISPIEDAKIFCVPFVDFDGVIDGDQGKFRDPHDHYVDYDMSTESIYPSTAAIRKYVEKNGSNYAFDFHAPWHLGGVNDTEFIVHNSYKNTDRLNKFGEIFEKEITDKSFAYYHKDDFPFMVKWNVVTPNFVQFMLAREENEMSFSLETAYFGLENNIVSQEKLVELGKCFARALKQYVIECEGKIPLKTI